MASLAVPESGLTLLESSSETKSESKPPQVMQLDLAPGVLDDICKSARHGGKGVNVSFGKTINLHYGNKSHRLTATPISSLSQLYEYLAENETDLAVAGLVSHRLAMQQAKQDVAGADEALAKLKSQLASHEQAKQSKQIKFVPDGSKLPPPIKQTAAAVKQQSVKTNAMSLMKKSNHRTLLNHDTTRSMPASPSLNAASNTLPPKPTSTSTPALANGKTQRLQALRVPLIHFLAARPASTKLLAQHLGCKQDETLEVLQKVGKEYRLDSTKWDLTDKIFKELDVWNFNYPNQEDRELAIGRARSAFDRMRLSTTEKLWDKLLPKHERGKGKILSQLNLHKGPIQQSTTPKIQIQHPANESKAHQATDNDSDQKDRLAPSDAEPTVRSKSHGPIKQTKISEKEAQSKRLLSKGPKKVIPDTKAKEVHPAVKKGGAQKKTVPKSSEFVNESDEEDGLGETAIHPAQPQKPTHNESLAKKSKPPTLAQSAVSDLKVNGISKPAKVAETSKSSPSGKVDSPKPSTTPRKDGPLKEKLAAKAGKDVKAHQPKLPEKKVLPSGASSPAPKPPNLPEKKASSRASSPAPRTQGSTAMKKSLSRQRTTSSPHKPSPLGSSPPTNASDFENTGRSSNSSTPSLTQAINRNATPNGVGPTINGHVRNTSEHTLKRKAGDLDSDIHNHGGTVSNGATNGHLNGFINGNPHASKRLKTFEEESPKSDSSESELTRSGALKKAQDFKRYYANYQKQYIEVSKMNDVPQEKLDDLMKMHHRLAELKGQITSGLVRI